MSGGVPDVVNHAKFHQNRFRDFGSLKDRSLPFFYAWRYHHHHHPRISPLRKSWTKIQGRYGLYKRLGLWLDSLHVHVCGMLTWLLFAVHTFVVRTFQLMKRPGTSRRKSDASISNIRQDTMSAFYVHWCLCFVWDEQPQPIPSFRVTFYN